MNSPMPRGPSFFSRSFEPKTLAFLVVMLVHLQHLEQLDRSRFALHVNRAIRPIETHGTLSAARSLQGLIMEPLVLTNLANPAFLDQRHPQPEFPTDDFRDEVKLLLDHATPEDPGHRANHNILLAA